MKSKYRMRRRRGGVLADEGRDFSGNYRSDARWLVLCDSVLTEGKFNRLSLSANSGSVIRLVYTTNAGTDVGFDGNRMTVNKDDLLTLMASVDKTQLEMNPLLKAAWQAASSAAVSTMATQSAVKAAQEQLYFALNPRIPAQSIQDHPLLTDPEYGQAGCTVGQGTAREHHRQSQLALVE